MPEDLDLLRHKIQETDEQIINLLGHRRQLSQQAARVKFEARTQIAQKEIFELKLLKLTKLAKSLGVPSKLIRRLWRNIHHDSIKTQQLIVEALERNAK